MDNKKNVCIICHLLMQDNVNSNEQIHYPVCPACMELIIQDSVNGETIKHILQYRIPLTTKQRKEIRKLKYSKDMLLRVVAVEISSSDFKHQVLSRNLPEMWQKEPVGMEYRDSDDLKEAEMEDFYRKGKENSDLQDESHLYSEDDLMF